MVKRQTATLSPRILPEEALADYRMAYLSRQASLLGRREVLSGKAKFGIFGDGKELPQVALARVFRKGDFRSGYYRDQTLAFAAGIASVREFFAQLYADSDIARDPHSGGRQMNSHFSTRYIGPEGEWLNQKELPISAADASPTASQMPRMAGLVQASRLYRLLPELADMRQFSEQGREVIFGAIGNASCAEGHFWETLNAIGIIQGPLVMSIWDDEYGISVPNEFQLTKKNLSEMLQGFRRTEQERGFELFTVRAWDYEALVEAYRRADELARESHIPCIVHVTEVTQPQGHSTSGSHERYKTPERLEWEKAHDCLLKMRQYLLEGGISTEAELEQMEREARDWVIAERREAWKAYQAPIQIRSEELLSIAGQLPAEALDKQQALEITSPLRKAHEHSFRSLFQTGQRLLILSKNKSLAPVQRLRSWLRELEGSLQGTYDRYLHAEGSRSPLRVGEVAPRYGAQPESLSGFELLNRCFDDLLARDPRVIAFGEDVGKLGDVNQGFAGLQAKYGPHRVMDTGIREASIVGQAIGLAMRGLRPIAEIQYLDYLLYGFQTLSDDLATLRYRSAGGQAAPVIIRTRGHRLEGIWHAGSPLGMMVHGLRGMHIAVPRNMTQAAAFYHTFLQGDDPAIVVEVLNAYRLKEALPENLPDITLPLGVPEVIREGSDLSIVTYGACCRIALEAAALLEQAGIDAEIIDVRTLLPFDTTGVILQSLRKTSRILFLDEDVPGGATAYMMQEVLEKQGGYYYLDSAPQTLTASEHRPAYGDDGDYFSKPQVEHVFYAAYEMMHEADPAAFPRFY
jgi:pyruvate/2-oxoglutarate/acetoin dehydrogenase E1 component/TPP-dependent pyruvate/acetoin dehydrogenase alpha subunit